MVAMKMTLVCEIKDMDEYKAFIEKAFFEQEPTGGLVVVDVELGDAIKRSKIIDKMVRDIEETYHD